VTPTFLEPFENCY